MRAKAITGVAAGLFLQKGANDCALNVPGITQCAANDCAKQKAEPGIRAQETTPDDPATSATIHDIGTSQKEEKCQRGNSKDE